MTQRPEVTRVGRAPSPGRRLIKAAREAAGGGEFTAASGAHAWMGFIFILQKFTNEEEVNV